MSFLSTRVKFKKGHFRLERWLNYQPPTQPYDLFVLGLLQANSNDVVLDDGAGNARFATRLASIGCEVIALDLNLKMLKRARKDCNTKGSVRVHIVLGDMVNLPLRNGSVDKVLCIHNLWYVRDYKGAISEMHRVLCSHGICIVDQLNSLDPKKLFDKTSVEALLSGGFVDVGRTARSFLRAFGTARVQVYSVLNYEPLRVVEGIRNLARRFVAVLTEP